MSDPISRLGRATKRAKSDVANKIISMLLHEVSRKLTGSMRVEGLEYQNLVRETFGVLCPYCLADMSVDDQAVVEHLDGMNRYRAGLHVPGNVLVACKKCNTEKRREDSAQTLRNASSGWEAFLSHDGSGCEAGCRTCEYWRKVWGDQKERTSRLNANVDRIRSFRTRFPICTQIPDAIRESLPRLYADCQEFADREIRVLLEQHIPRASGPPLPAITLR
jgi:hypothetical protein